MDQTRLTGLENSGLGYGREKEATESLSQWHQLFGTLNVLTTSVSVNGRSQFLRRTTLVGRGPSVPRRRGSP